MSTMEALRLDQGVDPAAIATALAPWLDDLEARLDPTDEDRLLDAWRAFADGRCPGTVFQPRRAALAPPRITWPEVTLDAALDDPRLMVLHQLRGVSDVLAAGGGAVLCVRANYGTGILPSLFGVPVVKMPAHMQTLPGSLPLGRVAMDALVAAGVPQLDRGVWPLVRTVGATFVRCTQGRPRLQRHLHIYHPDLQGPMDVLEMAWGTECFTSLVEEPELVHAVLRIITDTYRAVLADWDAVVPDRHPGYCAHWGFLHRGHIMLRDDSAMNLSPRMFTSFIAPYDGELLRTCGGGAIHACGKTDHYLDRATSLPGMHAFQFGQPDHNDPVKLVAATVAKGVQIVGLREDGWAAIGAAVAPGRRGLVHLAA